MVVMHIPKSPMTFWTSLTVPRISHGLSITFWSFHPCFKCKPKKSNIRTPQYLESVAFNRVLSLPFILPEPTREGKLRFGVKFYFSQREPFSLFSGPLHLAAILYASWIKAIFILKYDILEKYFL